MGARWQGLSKTVAAVAAAVARTEFNHENPGIPRRVGGEVLSVSCGYLVGLCCSQRVLDFEFLRALMPLGASGSCLNLALLETGSGCWKAILFYLAPVPRCCWSAGLLEGGTGQILWLPLSTLMGIGFSLEGTKRIIS